MERGRTEDDVESRGVPLLESVVFEANQRRIKLGGERQRSRW